MATSSQAVPTDEGRRPLRAVMRVFFTLGDPAIVSATSFLSGMIVAKATSKEQFGLYGLGFTIVLIATELQSALISTPQTVFGPRYSGDRNSQFQGSMLLKLLMLAAFNVTILLIGAALAQTAGKHDIARMLAAIAVSVTSMHLGLFVRVTCFAHLNSIGAFFVDLATATLQLATLLTLWHYGVLEAWTAWLAIPLAAFPSAVVFLLFWRTHLRITRAGAKEDFHITWLQTRFVLVSSLMWILGMHIYAWLIEFFADREGVAEWTACLAIAAVGNPLMYGMMNILGPQIAHRHQSLPSVAFRRYMWLASAAFFVVMAGFAVTVTVLADWLMLHIYTPEYVGHTAIVAMMAFGFAARVPGFVASRGLFALNRADLELLNNIAPLVVLAGLGIFLTYRYHVAGAAFCLLLAQVIGSITRLICFESCMKAESQLRESAPTAPLAVTAGAQS